MCSSTNLRQAGGRKRLFEEDDIIWKRHKSLPLELTCNMRNRRDVASICRPFRIVMPRCDDAHKSNIQPTRSRTKRTYSDVSQDSLPQPSGKMMHSRTLTPPSIGIRITNVPDSQTVLKSCQKARVRVDRLGSHTFSHTTVKVGRVASPSIVLRRVDTHSQPHYGDPPQSATPVTRQLRSNQSSDHQGNPLDRHGRPSDHQGRPSDHQDRPSDHQGRPSDHQGRPSDNQDRPSDNQDRNLDRLARPLNRHGRPSQQQHRASYQQSMSSRWQSNHSFGDIFGNAVVKVEKLKVEQLKQVLKSSQSGSKLAQSGSRSSQSGSRLAQSGSRSAQGRSRSEQFSQAIKSINVKQLASKVAGHTRVQRLEASTSPLPLRSSTSYQIVSRPSQSMSSSAQSMSLSKVMESSRPIRKTTMPNITKNSRDGTPLKNVCSARESSPSARTHKASPARAEIHTGHFLTRSRRVAHVPGKGRKRPAVHKVPLAAPKQVANKSVAHGKPASIPKVPPPKKPNHTEHREVIGTAALVEMIDRLEADIADEEAQPHSDYSPMQDAQGEYLVLFVSTVSRNMSIIVRDYCRKGPSIIVNIFTSVQTIH